MPSSSPLPTIDATAAGALPSLFPFSFHPPPASLPSSSSSSLSSTVVALLSDEAIALASIASAPLPYFLSLSLLLDPPSASLHSIFHRRSPPRSPLLSTVGRLPLLPLRCALFIIIADHRRHRPPLRRCSSPLCPLHHHYRPPAPSPSSPAMFTMAFPASSSSSSPSFTPLSFHSGHQDRASPSPPAPSSPHRCRLFPLPPSVVESHRLDNALPFSALSPSSFSTAIAAAIAPFLLHCGLYTAVADHPTECYNRRLLPPSSGKPFPFSVDRLGGDGFG